MNEIDFAKQLQNTLDDYADLERLGAQSPFAWPYFLGKWLPRDAVSTQQRGEALQKLIQAAITKIEGKNALACQDLLRQVYCAGAKQTQEKWAELLEYPITTYKRRHKEALELLGENLLALAHPALRLEMPPQNAPPIGRETDIKRIHALLRQSKSESVTLIGASGIGKTALGAEIAARWIDDRRTYLLSSADTHSFFFWYTFRPGLNDRIENLVFALGLFAHDYGSSSLWQELLVTSDKMMKEGEQTLNKKTLGLVRNALQEIQPAPLLCFDEIDVLQQVADPDYAPLRHLLEELRNIVPTLFIGQRLLFFTEHTITLPGISQRDLTEVLIQERIKLSSHEAQQLHQLTQGNPRLIRLWVALIKAGSQENELISAFAQTPSLEFVLQRMLQHLSEPELFLVQQLSVFRTATPIQEWLDNPYGNAVESLQVKQLLQSDGNSVEIPPIFRPLLYQNLSGEQKQTFHWQAAKLFSRLGIYTEAAYHYLESGQTEVALSQWRAHRHQEIAQGQTAAALKLFRNITSSALPSHLYEQIQLLCGDLASLLGQPNQALADIRSLLHKRSLTGIAANELAGRTYNDRGEWEKAETSFHTTLSLTRAQLELYAIKARKGLAWDYLNQFRREDAERELERAAYEIENMRGNLADDQENYAEAETYYQNALQQAELLPGGAEEIAKTCNNLVNVYRTQGKFQQCIEFAERAVRLYQQIGKPTAIVGSQSTLATAYNLAERYTLALETIGKAEHSLRMLGSSYPRLQALCAVVYAESYLGLENFQEAKKYAYQVINEWEEDDFLPDGYRIYGEALAGEGNWAEAIQSLQQSINLADQNKSRYFAAFGWRALGNTYAKQGNRSHAFHAYQQAYTRFADLKLVYEIQRLQTCAVAFDLQI